MYTNYCNQFEMFFMCEYKQMQFLQIISMAKKNKIGSALSMSVRWRTTQHQCVNRCWKKCEQCKRKEVGWRRKPTRIVVIMQKCIKYLYLHKDYIGVLIICSKSNQIIERNYLKMERKNYG